MLKLQPLDPNVPIFQQLGADVSPAILGEVLQVAESDIPACSRHGKRTRTG